VGPGKVMFGRSLNSFAAFGRDRRGNVAMLWGLLAAGLLGLIGLTVDFTRAQAIHTQLQNAADGAALAAARMPANVSLADRTTAARAFFNAEASDYGPGANFVLAPVGTQGFQVTADTYMEGSLSRLISNEDWHIDVESQAVRGGVNLEVALVLDTTGSMSGQRITDLRASAGELVDIIVQPSQTPYYSKMALVTYANGVNVGGYAASVRGAATPGRSLSNPANNWLSTTTHTITNIAKASPCNSSGCVLTVTSNNHGYAAGTRIQITGVSGMTQVNNQVFIVSSNNLTANSFRLATFASGGSTYASGNGYNNYTSGGTMRTCLTTGCEVVFTTSTDHGFSANDYIYVTGVSGMAASNGGQAINNPDPITLSNPTLWRVGSVLSTTSFSLSGSYAPNYAAYTSGGTAYCLTAGCEYYRFTNPNSAVRVFRISTCVTERVGSNVTTDAPPSTTLVGRQYPVTSNPCDSGTGLIPLTTDTSALHARISGLSASGSTSGHVGAAWGWYTLSPNFGYLWSSNSRPAEYGAPETLKIAVLMTDGAFNSPYCNGVIAANAVSGSGSTADHINCNATNGSSAAQTMAMCAAMKQQGIIIYTIGFHIENDNTAEQVMSTCATDSAHYKSASDGAALLDAFRQIGQSISQLRISQ
jgi:Flp pilus assembly protein TadG